MPAPAGDSHDVVSVMPRASKKWASSDRSRSSALSRSSRQSSASTVVPVSSELMTMRESLRVSTVARARRLMAALIVCAPGWNR